MIVQRLGEAVRNQNWITVLIEFVVVVVGIFVGLQANNWNEARLERAQERGSLERLLEEADNSVAYIERQVEFGTSIIDSQRALLEVLYSGKPLPDDTAPLEWGFETLNFFPAMAPMRSVYDELTAAGGLRQIRSSHVRDMIGLYYADLDFFLAQLSYFRTFSTSAGNDPGIAAIDYVKAKYDPNEEDGRRYEFDWLGLRVDANLETLFVDKYRNQKVMNTNRERLLNRARIMCEAIAEAVNRECRPALGDGSD